VEKFHEVSPYKLKDVCIQSESLVVVLLYLRILDGFNSYLLNSFALQTLRLKEILMLYHVRHMHTIFQGNPRHLIKSYNATMFQELAIH